MRVAYLVTRFPVDSETFVMRELNDVADMSGAEVYLLSLRPPRRPFMHPAAKRLASVHHCPTPQAAAHAVAWWLVRRPLRLLGCLREALRADAGSEQLRALAAVALACAHARALARHPVDHVHAHFANFPALAAWVCHRLTGTTYSFTAHAHDIFIDQSHLATVARSALEIVAISEFNVRYLEPYASETPVRLIHCGIRPERYRFQERELPRDGTVSVLCIASLKPYKGHASLLEAVASDARLVARARLVLVGDGPLRQELKTRARQLGLGPTTRFTGSLDEAAVIGELERADVFVAPSIRSADGQMDGIPVALMEAMACGIPVVSTRISGIPELVIDGRTGLLADPGDHRGLAQALVQTLVDPDASLRRAREARDHVVHDFDAREQARKLVALFASPGGQSDAVHLGDGADARGGGAEGR